MAYSTMNEVAHTEFCYYYQNRGERCSAQLQYLYGREPRQLSRKRRDSFTRTVPNQFSGFGCRAKSASIEPPRFALIRSMG